MNLPDSNSKAPEVTEPFAGFQTLLLQTAIGKLGKIQVEGVQDKNDGTGELTVTTERKIIRITWEDRGAS